MDDQGNFKGGIGVKIEGEKAWVQILELGQDGSLSVTKELQPVSCIALAQLGDMLLGLACRMAGATTEEEKDQFVAHALRTGRNVQIHESGQDMSGMN